MVVVGEEVQYAKSGLKQVGRAAPRAVRLVRASHSITSLSLRQP